jgi:hypothetical protein
MGKIEYFITSQRRHSMLTRTGYEIDLAIWLKQEIKEDKSVSTDEQKMCHTSIHVTI